MNTRNKAMDWWMSLSFESKFFRTIEWLKSKGMNLGDRHPHSLTGREIEEIYKLRTK